MPSKKLPKNEPKRFDFTKEEWLYLSEKQSILTHTNSLISRYVTVVVCERLGINPKTTKIMLTPDGAGITTEPLPPQIVVPK